MSINKVDCGWKVDTQPVGRGSKQFRKTFVTKSDALAYEAWLKTKLAQAPDWALPKKDLRKLSDLVEIWQQHHGKQLKAKNTYPKLKNLCKALGDPFADKFSAEDFANYGSRRLDARISANFINRDHAYLRAV